MDGPTMLTKMREGGDGTPVIMLIAESHRPTIAGAMKAGITDYVIKPFDPKEAASMGVTGIGGVVPLVAVFVPGSPSFCLVQRANHVEEVVHAEGLLQARGNVAWRPCDIAAHPHHGDVRESHVARHGAEDARAVEPGHPPVQEDSLRAQARPKELEPFDAVTGSSHLDALSLDDLHEQIPQILVVLDEKQREAGSRRRAFDPVLSLGPPG